MPATTAEIAESLLATLTPYTREVLSRRAVFSALSGGVGLTTAVTRDLLERRLPSATGVPRMVDAFMRLAADDPRAAVDPGRHRACSTTTGA